MTDGERLTAILAQYAIPCEKVSFRGKLDALAAGLGIQTQGRLLGDVLDDIAAKMGVERDNRLYGTFIRKLYEDVTSGEDATLSGNPLILENCIGGKTLGALHVYGKSTQNGVPTPTAPVPIVSAGDGGTVTVTVSDGANESQTLTLQTPNALPGIPVTSGGNYTDENGQQWVCDEVDLARGVYAQKCGIGTIGTLSGSYNDKYDAFLIDPNVLPTGIALTTHFSCYNSFGKLNNAANGFAYSAGAGAYAIKLGDGTKDNADFITKIKALNVKYAYILDTPVETALSAAEIAAYKALTTYAPTTIVTAGGGAWLAATYRRAKAAKDT